MLSGEPFIPETVTVHLGTPDSGAENVTVSFPEYIKNVASSEIYPTWPENALRANIYVIISYVLNRIYTEWYRARGYHFDITSSTQYDQAFVYGREIFENISHLVDELFPYYIRRENNIEPLFAAFCDGDAVTCAGLSQWGTVALANQGKTPFEILQHYYGNDIILVKSEDIRIASPTYPNAVLREGEVGRDVQTIQTQLNRISRNFPEIPKLPEIDGIYDALVAKAVRTFQKIFNLPQTGEVDETTWYQLSYIYTSVKHLAELQSEGLSIEEITRDFPEVLREGDSGNYVRSFQYYLAVVGAYYASVLPIQITGEYDADTAASVISFQQTYGLPQTGIMDRRTWNDLYAAYLGILESQPSDPCVRLYPNQVLREGVTSENVRILQQYLTYISQFDSAVPAVTDTGYFGPLTKTAVQAFQREYGLNVTGIVGAVTWDAIAGIYGEIQCGAGKRPYQAPGYIIRAQGT
ncbi:MAG: peptidoglycan-binding protein [Oscillospiraceae bacterium]|nr:peptidoglycan-binding protein [Oscillospiraceae bacterium]